VSGQVEKVNVDLLSHDVGFLHAVVYTNCGDISLHKPTLAIPLYKAGFTNLGVSYGEDLN
jgi:hypothetical protein